MFDKFKCTNRKIQRRLRAQEFASTELAQQKISGRGRAGLEIHFDPALIV